MADETRVKQLLSNLFENSARYTDAGGSLKLSVRKNNAKIVLTIDDSAPSVPSESLGLLFDRLYRVDPSRSRNTGSSGLGLAICKSIVDAHDGFIDAEHSSLGGVCIRIVLPAYSGEE